ncbi:MAG: hypothetical protein C0404_04980 [Verrucomicrobia bacterium]|nr:hypothetical protein [Verrucomicrobiota bacterium]
MRIRTQSLMGIVPLFLGLGAVIAALVFYLERREMLWGLKEEGAGLAVTIAAFAQENGLTRMAELSATKEGNEQVGGPLGKVMRWRRAMRILAFRSDDGRVIFDIASTASVAGAVLWTQADLAALKGDAAVFSRVERDPKHGLIMKSFAPVRDERAAMHAAICVITDANSLDAQARNGIRTAGLGIGAAFLLGLACAIVVSMFLSERVQTLSDAMVRATRRQDEPVVSHPGLISEINDMDNTLNTMISVLRGVIAKTHRNLQDLEMYRTEEDLAEAFEQSYWTPKALVKKDMTFVVRLVEGNRHGDFLDLVEAGQHVYCITGRSAEKGGLRSARKASATLRFLGHQLLHRDLEGALEMTALLFEVADLQLIDWDAESGRMVVHKYSRKKETFGTEEITMKPSESRAFHDLGDEVDRRFRIYIGNFPQSSVMALMDELMLIVRSVEPIPQGTMVLISRGA